MKQITGYLTGAAFLMAAAASADDTAFMKGKRMAVGDYTSGKVCIVEADGNVSWTQKAPNCNDLWILPGGSILFSTGRGVKEVAKDGTVKFEYKSTAEIYAVQRLASGNTFVGECTSGRLLQLAPDGKVVKEVALLPADKPGGHAYIRNARVLTNGNFLVAHYGGRTAAEYAPLIDRAAHEAAAALPQVLSALRSLDQRLTDIERRLAP